MPIDWSYDFEAHGWNDQHGGLNPNEIPRWKEYLRICEENIGKVETTTDTGWPKVGYGRVLDVDMRDGEPKALLDGRMGARWVPWFMLHRPRVIEADPLGKGGGTDADTR